MYKETRDPGAGAKYGSRTKRVINKDGSFNVTRVGNAFQARHIYQELISMSWLGFFGIVMAFYILLNFLFALLYLVIGIEQLSGMPSEGFGADLAYAFFFSTQTFTTVGYGAINPIGFAANVIASFEAMVGLLGFAFATGLLYGRFSRPSARILFSEKAIVTRLDDGRKAFEFRIVNQRKNVLMDMEASILLMTHDAATQNRKYYNLPLETPRIKFFPLNWTIVHVIDEKSPLIDMTEEKFNACDAEVLILIKGFDDSFSQFVHSRNSYKANEVEWGRKFTRPFYTDEEGQIILEIDKIGEVENIELN